MKINRYILCILLVSTLLVSTGCDGISNSNDLKTETKNFELDGTKKLSLNLNMGAGKLDVQSGTDTLVETEFIYDVPKWKPIVEYAKAGSDSTLNIDQVAYTKKGIGNSRNDWNLNLNKNIPTDLNIFLGVGNSNLQLDNMNLESVKVETGAGELFMDLSGNWKKDVTVKVDGGVGNTTIILPKEIGVIANIKNDIGEISVDGLKKLGNSYVNDAYGKSEITMSLEINLGIGETKLILSK